jgi:Fe-S-cluster containining protein
MSDQHNKLPWYADGLKFSCSGCGDCCTGAPGFVWVNQQEIAELAAHLELSLGDFQDQYTRRVGARISLKEFPNGSCVFFDEENRNCQVYALRPRQCRTWPFWESNLKTPESWEYTCSVCPGSGRGKLYQLDEIEHQKKVIRI